MSDHKTGPRVPMTDEMLAEHQRAHDALTELLTGDEGHRTWIETETIRSPFPTWAWVAFGIALLALLVVPPLVAAR